MNSFAFITVALAMVSAISAVPVEDIPHNDFYSVTGQCIPNKQFIDQCNQCHCGPDGKTAACTLKACQTPEKPRIDGFSSTEGLSCVPGKVFFDNCNFCTCSGSGKSAFCTLIAGCPVNARSRRSVENYSDLPHIDNFEETGECTPGQVFYDKCNTCRCSDDGKAAGCTLMACLGYEKIRIDNYAEVQKCPAGKTFYDKCNVCTCAADGVTAACTLMACP